MLGRILKSERVLFIFALLGLFLFFGYSLYNINDTNRYVDSLLKSNYYQGTNLNDYLTKKIDNELGNLLKEKVEKNELYSVISFNKSASRSELSVIVFSAFSVLFLVLIGFLVWSSNKQRVESQKVVDDLEQMRKDATIVSTSVGSLKEEAKTAVEKIRKMQAAARESLIMQIRYKNTAERFSSDNKDK